MQSTILASLAAATVVGKEASLGDRLVLEIHYGEKYEDLPLTADLAVAQGWQVQDECQEGLGRRAHPTQWNDKHGDLHLWFDKAGAVMGYGVSVEQGVAAPWRKVGDKFQLDFLTRDPASACGAGGDLLAKGSVGDRLLMINEDLTAVQIPMTLAGAFDKKYHDGGPCFPDMGWHMMYDRHEVSTPTPVYAHSEGFLLGMNLNSYASQERPSFEYPAPKEGKAVDGWHVYFQEHKGACEGMPEAARPETLPPAQDPKKGMSVDFTCTPFFGNLWVQTLTTVVDLHATGSLCESEECQFIHYIGPNENDGFATKCVPPAPADGCHCYHQVTYASECQKDIMTSTATGTEDSKQLFNADGVLESCADKVISHTVIGWASPAEDPISCDCASAVQV